MGHISSLKLLLAALIATGSMLSTDAVEAGSMTFLAPRQGSVRHNGGTLLRGGIKSISDEEVVVVSSSGEKSVAMSTVTSVTSADGAVKFYPAQETLDEFLAKSAGMRGATIVRDSTPGGGRGAGDAKMIGTVSDAYAKSIGMQPASAPKASSSSGGFVQSGGFAGPSQRPQGLARLEAPSIPELDAATVAKMEQERKTAEADASAQKFALPGGGEVKVIPSSGNSRFALPAAGEEVLICSNPNCRKEVPGAKYGQKCPYCGVIWARESVADAVAANPPGSVSSSPVVDPKNPFAKAPAAPGPAAAALPQPGAPPPVTPVAAPPEGFSLETIPWWGKLLGFGASIMVLMWVMGRR
jgi:hypothetical protein